MSASPPNCPRLRAALTWWRSACAAGTPPDEAEFVSQDPRNYARLLGDAFIVDEAPDGALAFRYVGTEIADYIGRCGPGQTLDLSAERPDSALIRDVVGVVSATQTPQIARGRITASSPVTSGEFEVLCLPLATARGGAAMFCAAARAGLTSLPPAPLIRRIDVTSVASA